MGYLFPSAHLGSYRPVLADIEVPLGGFLNYSEAASRLDSQTPVIHTLVELGILAGPTGFQLGRSKLVAAADVQRFSSQYVRVHALARQLRVVERWLRYYLKKSGAPMLTVAVGSSQKVYFLEKEATAKLQIPPPGKPPVSVP